MRFKINLDMEKLKDGFSVIKKTGKVLKNEAQNLASKHLDFIPSPYNERDEKKEMKKLMNANISLTNAFYGDTIEDILNR